jgi:hypothetical protein
VDNTDDIIYRKAYRLTCWKNGQFRHGSDNAILDPAERLRKLVDLIANDLGTTPDDRESIQRGVVDAMAGRLPAS